MTYENIGPRSRATAEALLAAAEKVGVPHQQVRTTIRGYVVPPAVADEYRRMIAGETQSIEEEEKNSSADTESVDVAEEAPSGLPDATWKNPEIVAYAAEKGIDLGDATKKADMLAVIAADTKEE
jgi:hypothetical protein